MPKKLLSVATARPQESANLLSKLLCTDEDRIRRDAFVLISPEETDCGSLMLGYTVIYPGCSTKGHAHPEQEEIYFFVKGRGVMTVGEESFEVKEGDALYVPKGPFHSTSNPYATPLEFVWVTNPHR